MNDDLQPVEELAAYDATFMDRNAIRVRARQVGITLDYTSGEQVDDLITACAGDVDFAITAATRRPRPAWVAAIIGELVDATPTNMTR